MRWTNCWALCHYGTRLAGGRAVASHVSLEAENVDGKLAHRVVETVQQESRFFEEAIYHGNLEISEQAAHVSWDKLENACQIQPSPFSQGGHEARNGERKEESQYGKHVQSVEPKSENALFVQACSCFPLEI